MLDQILVTVAESDDINVIDHGMHGGSVYGMLLSLSQQALYTILYVILELHFV